MSTTAATINAPTPNGKASKGAGARGILTLAKATAIGDFYVNGKAPPINGYF